MKTKCAGVGQPVATQMFAGGKVIGKCGACNRVHGGLDMSKPGNVSPLHYTGTSTYGGGMGPGR